MPSMAIQLGSGCAGPALHGCASCYAGKSGAHIHVRPPLAVPAALGRAFGGARGDASQARRLTLRRQAD
jgi:hypothetical protein